GHRVRTRRDDVGRRRQTHAPVDVHARTAGGDEIVVRVAVDVGDGDLPHGATGADGELGARIQPLAGNLRNDLDTTRHGEQRVIEPVAGGVADHEPATGQRG